METKVRSIEIRTAKGKPILSLELIDCEVVLRDSVETPAAQSRQVKEQTSQAGSQTSNESPMTDAQKRYLFRILAEQGLEGDKAHDHLKQLFGVDSLQEVGKLEASRMIESLLEKVESK
jgi:hypothetical protein